MLIKIKCPACGADINADTSRSIVFCQECGEKISFGSGNETEQMLESEQLRRPHDPDYMTQYTYTPQCAYTPQADLVTHVHERDLYGNGAQREQPKETSPMWTIVFGITALALALLSWIPEMWWLTLFVGGGAIALAVVALVKNYKLKGMSIAAIPIAAISVIVSLASTSSFSFSHLKNADVVGTYVGDDGSVLSLMPDGTAEYFMVGYTRKDSGSWAIDRNQVVWEWNRYGKTTITSDFKKTGDKILFESDSSSWKDEYYIKTSNDAKSYSVVECYSILYDYFGDSVTSDFKRTMDSLESFVDEYVHFMKNYDEMDGWDMLDIYLDFLAEYAEMLDSLESIDTDDLTAPNLIYYYIVTRRMEEKLATIE